MTWSARRRAWEAKRLGPALDRAPERRIRFSTISDTDVDRLYGPWSWAPAATTDGNGSGDAAGGGGPTARRPPRRAPPPASPAAGTTSTRSATSACPGEPPFTRGIHPTGLPQPALDDADVRGLRRGRGHERAGSRRCSRAGQTGLSIAYDMPTLYGYDTDEPEAEGEFGTCGVAREQPRRHGGPARRPAARPRLDVDDDQLAGRPDLGDVHRRRREGRRAAGRARGHDPERHPQGVRRPEGVPVPARAVDAPRDRHDRVRDARDAALEHDLDQRLPHPRGRLDRDPGAGVHDRRRDGLRRGRDRARPARRRLRAAAELLLQLATATSSRRSRSSGRRAGSGTS